MCWSGVHLVTVHCGSITRIWEPWGALRCHYLPCNWLLLCHFTTTSRPSSTRVDAALSAFPAAKFFRSHFSGVVLFLRAFYWEAFFVSCLQKTRISRPGNKARVEAAVFCSNVQEGARIKTADHCPLLRSIYVREVMRSCTFEPLCINRANECKKILIIHDNTRFNYC